jgi:uncharacterized protein involved in tolerance to divalent cations
MLLLSPCHNLLSTAAVVYNSWNAKTHMRSEVLTAVKSSMFFWVVIPCGSLGKYEGSMYLWNVSVCLHVQSALQPRTTSTVKTLLDKITVTYHLYLRKSKRRLERIRVQQLNMGESPNVRPHLIWASTCYTLLEITANALC